MVSKPLSTSALLLAGSLALGVASAARAGDAEDSPYSPPKQMTVSPLGVDLQSGKFSYSATDLSIGPLTLERSYLGGQPIYGNAHFGPNWTHNHSIYAYQKDTLDKLGNTLVVIGGKTYSFNRTATSASWDGPSAEGTFLEGQDGAFVFTDQQGNVYTFDKNVPAIPADKIQAGWPNQRIGRIDYANGHTITYTYNGAKQLTQIASNYGYSIQFGYAGATSSITSACGYNDAVGGPTLCVSYSYGAPNSSNLASVLDLAGQRWGYDYASDIQLTCVRKVNSSDCLIRNEYVAGMRPRWVMKQTAADGGVWTYRYDAPDPDYDLNASHGLRETTGAGYTDPEGSSVWAEFYSGQLKKYYVNGRIDDPAWNGADSRVTELEYYGLELAKLIHKEGNSVSYARRGELVLSETWTPKPGSGLAPVFTASQYPDRGPDGNSNQCDPSVGRKRCNKPIWTEDFNRNRTQYSYDPSHGGVLTETGPAVNNVSPQKRYSYVQRTARLANGAAAGGPIWLVDRIAFCRDGNPSGNGCALGPGDEVVTSFDYGPATGPSNLNLHSETVTANGVSRRTCYGYDGQGDKISTTRPNGLCQ